MNRILLNPRWWWLAVLGWGNLAGVSLLWSWHTTDHDTERLALDRGRFVFGMVESSRPAGQAFPQEVSGARIRLVTLHPVDSAGAPDGWETAALGDFVRGKKERFALVDEGHGMEVRYMAPVRGEAGGLSIRFPAAGLSAAAADHKRTVLWVHLAAWGLLSMLTLLALSRIRADVVSLRHAKEQQDALAERRTAQLREQMQEREAAEARLRLLVESSGDGIYGLDTDGRITFINPTALRLLGYESAGQVLGREAHRLWQTVPAATDDLSRTLAEGLHSHREDGLFRRADGVPISVEYRAAPLLTDSRIIGAVVSFADVSERKCREHELRKLSSAVEHSPDSVVITNVNGEIEYVNHKFVETTGYPVQELLGRKPSLLKSGQTRLEIYDEMWRTITSGQVWHGTLLNRKRDGELFWEEESIAPIKDERGNITHFVGVKEDITERRRLEQKIWRQANFDALTELPNRRLFYDRLQQALARAQRDESRLALMYIDLDGFKEVNDRLGHGAGDELLREAARRLLHGVRRSDTVARMGGDEFTVILSSFDAGGDTVAIIAERIRSALADPFLIEPRAVTISASIGVAFYPEDGASMEQLLKHADLAMYRAKEDGRNGVFYFGSLRQGVLL